VRSQKDFAAFKTGAILVARTTNPAWTPLFFRAAAIITECGGPLSHGAVTAREIGIPAVMSIPGVFNTLPDGIEVLVNGTEGYITKAPGTAEAAPGAESSRI
jgi:pyruvate,water dikinase